MITFREKLIIAIDLLLLITSVTIYLAYRSTCAELAELKSALTIAEVEAQTKTEDLNHEITTIKQKASADQALADARVNDMRASVSDSIKRMQYYKNKSVSDSAGARDRKDDAESFGKIADDLVSISEDGDRAIRRLNTCIDSYNAVMDSVNR